MGTCDVYVMVTPQRVTVSSDRWFQVCYCLFQGGATAALDIDFESVVLRKMKQAQERKELIEKMSKEEL